MTLENIKFFQIIKKPENFLRIFLALIFLTAGIFRIFNPRMAIIELVGLGLPAWLSPLIIFFEIVVGLFLLVNRYSRFIYYLLIIFIVIALGWAFTISGGDLLRSARELFVLNLNPTDIFLHFVFLIIIFTLLRLKK